jgi:hypothetical protein
MAVPLYCLRPVQVWRRLLHATVPEALARSKAKIGQADVVGVVGKADPAEVGNAGVLAVDDKLVGVGVAPAQGDLDGGVQLGDGRRIRR